MEEKQPGPQPGEHGERKEFEARLDGYADKLSRVVSDGVKKLEAAFDKGKANLQKDIDASDESRRLSGSPRMGLILLVAGLIWLLHSFGVLRQPIFPILLIVLGIYFLIRKR